MRQRAHSSHSAAAYMILINHKQMHQRAHSSSLEAVCMGLHLH